MRLETRSADFTWWGLDRNWRKGICTYVSLYFINLWHYILFSVRFPRFPKCKNKRGVNLYWNDTTHIPFAGDQHQWGSEAASFLSESSLPGHVHLPPGWSTLSCRRSRGKTHLWECYWSQRHSSWEGEIHKELVLYCWTHPPNWLCFDWEYWCFPDTNPGHPQHHIFVQSWLHSGVKRRRCFRTWRLSESDRTERRLCRVPQDVHQRERQRLLWWRSATRTEFCCFTFKPPHNRVQALFAFCSLRADVKEVQRRLSRMESVKTESAGSDSEKDKSIHRKKRYINLHVRSSWLSQI